MSEPSAADDDPLAPLARWCRAQDLPWGPTPARRLGQYLDLLERFNQSMNLIGPMPRAQIVTELLLDSLVAAQAAPPRGAMLDVGTGAGLPGLPLKLLYPEVSATLVEPRRKRVTFLRLAARRLELEDLEVLELRLEDLAPDRRFDYIISKAFRPPVTWLKLARPWLAEAGRVVCMTRHGELGELEAAAAQLGLAPCGQARAPHPTRDGVSDRVACAYTLAGASS